MLLLWSLNVQVDGDQLAVGWVWPANLPPSWPQVWRLSQQVNGLFLVLPVFTEMFLWNFLSLLIILIELFSVPRITAACEVSFYLRVRIELLKNSIRSPTPWLLSKYYKLATKIILKIYMRKIHRGGGICVLWVEPGHPRPRRRSPNQSLTEESRTPTIAFAAITVKYLPILNV